MFNVTLKTIVANYGFIFVLKLYLPIMTSNLIKKIKKIEHGIKEAKLNNSLE